MDKFFMRPNKINRYYTVCFICFTKLFQQYLEQHFEVFDNPIERMLYIKDDDFNLFSSPYYYL